MGNGSRHRAVGHPLLDELVKLLETLLPWAFVASYSSMSLEIALERVSAQLKPFVLDT